MVARLEGRDILFEVTTIGAVQRVAAIDAATGVEVVVQAPANAALADVRALALRKLERALDDGAALPTGNRGGVQA